MPSPTFQVLDERTVRREDGTEYDVLRAISKLPWVDQLCPLMPHQYAVLSKSPDWAWYALDAMVRWSPESYRAYFRGYPNTNRYWDAPDGKRYWRTRFEMNRCDPGSVEPLRRRDEGATRIKDWVGPPWAPNGSGKYFLGPDGRRWWPTDEAIAKGHEPCKACRRNPPPQP